MQCRKFKKQGFESGCLNSIVLIWDTFQILLQVLLKSVMYLIRCSIFCKVKKQEGSASDRKKVK
jgi:hypothetical protein